MDTFEKKISELDNLTEREKVQSIEAMKSQCICRDCPTYDECAKSNNELLYCFLGNSEKCISEEKKCICPKCPIMKQMELKNMFFCTRHSEEDQRK